MSDSWDAAQHEPVTTLADALHTLPDQLRPTDSGSTWASVPFTGVVYWEPGLSATDLTGRVVLGVGLRAGDPELNRAAAQLSSTGAATLVVRTGGAPESGVGDARLPVLLLQPGADWAHVANTLRALCAPQSRELVATVPAGDLFALANTLATLAGAAVSVVDAGGQVVGYSTHADQPIDDVRRQTTLALRETIPLSQDEDYRQVLGTDAAVYLPIALPGQFGRVARAVRSAGKLLGTVWVVQVDGGTAEATRQLLDATEPLVAQHLLQARNDAAERDRRTADLLHALFDDTGAARRAAAELLLPPDGTHVVVCAGYPVAGPDGRGRHLHRLLALVNTVAPAHFSRSHGAVVGHHIGILVTESDPNRVRRFAQYLTQRDRAAVVGIGRPAGTTQIARSHREAAAALSAGLAPLSTLRPADRPARVAAFDDVREQLGLMRVATVLDDLELTADDDVATLLTHDATNGSELATTLLIYLDAGQSVRATAESLHVHQNTIRYRLAVVRDEIGVDLDDPTRRLWLWLRLATTAVRPDGLLRRVKT